MEQQSSKEDCPTSTIFSSVVVNKIKEIENLLETKNNNSELNQDVQEKILNAKLDNCLERIKEVLTDELSDYYKISKGTSYLHLAVKTGCIKLIDLILSHVDVDDQNKLKYTPLHVAAINDRIDVVTFLLEKKARVNTQNVNGVTPLHDAVKNGNVDMVRLLLSHGAKPDYQSTENTVLHRAAKHGGYEEIDKALKQNPNIVKLVSWKKAALSLVLDNNKNSEAVILKIMKLLVKNGAEVDAPDSNDRTPLFIAVERRFFSVVKYLLSLGADANGYGKSLTIFEAVYNKDLNIVKSLLKHGANVNAIDSSGKTVLDFALEGDDVSTFHFLIKSGAKISLRNNGRSLLYTAVGKNLHDVAKMLIEKGVKPEELPGHRPSYLALAVSNKSEDMAKLLLDNGSELSDEKSLLTIVGTGSMNMLTLIDDFIFSVDTKSAYGQKLLDAAVHSPSSDMVQFWLDRGVDVNLEYKNRLPLESSFKAWSRDQAKTLIRHIAILAVSEKPVDERNAKLMEMEDWAVEYYSDCFRELERMRVIRVCEESETTFFEILTKRYNALVCCLRCRQVYDRLHPIATKLELFDSLEFKNYNYNIIKNYLHGTMRMMMMDAVKTVLQEAIGHILPYDIICKISEYFHDKDYKVFLQIN